MIVVHPDAEFLDDIAGKLKEYVLEEVNVKSVVTCNDPLMYASLRAEPDFSVLGKRLGKSMRVVAEAVKAMSQEEILSFEKAGEITIATHSLKPTDIKVVSRIQKLRKTSQLKPSDTVEVYFKSLDQDTSVSTQMLKSQEVYIKDAIGSLLLDPSLTPEHAVIIGDFQITLSRPRLVFNDNAILELYTGNEKYARALKVYLLSRDHSKLKSEFRLGNRKIKVDCIETLPDVDVVLGEHVFLTVGDYYSAIANHNP